jgi:predicted nucleotidyltransferase
MNQLRHDLPNNIKLFFTQLSIHLDNDLYFYGSVLRDDYIHGESDIDVAILTDNVYSTMKKLQYILNIDNNKLFYKIAWKIDNNYVYGYKLQYKNKQQNICTEFAIFDNKFKHIIIPEYIKTLYVPYYGIFMLYILKIIYYRLKLISKKSFQTIKRHIFNLCWNRKALYLVMKPK